ncbi:MAG: lysine biosynthesis protein LysX [Candidatus Aenigmarchaeota archaeon]|nr:lysine biosynthesis protein LysX [Candidatus Aenigmarchaeota archaeon]
MQIGLIVDRLRQDEKLIVEAARKSNVDIKIIDSSSQFFDITNFEKNEFKDIDVFLQRSVSTLRGLYITKILEEYGFKVVNDFHSSLMCLDKLRCSVALAKNGIPTPKTLVAFTEKAALGAIKDLGYPVIIKPILGSWARLVAKVNDEDAAKSVLEDRQMMGVWYSIFYLQKYVDKPNRDIRSTVIGDEVVAAIYRVNETGDWRTNTARGAKAVKCEITTELEELSLKSAEAMGQGMFGVDIMEDNGNLVVHEVNHSFEFKNVQRVTGIDVAGKIVDYLKEVGKK